MFLWKALAWLYGWWRHPEEVEEIPVSAVPVETPPIVTYTEPTEIRKYERERRKHDKFVTPQGELPMQEAKPHPVTQEIKPKLTPAVDEEARVLPNAAGADFIDEHHEDGGLVLYRHDEVIGEFNFRDTILEQLDLYFRYLKRMKRHDPDAYGLYRKVGATLLPYLATGAWKRDRCRPEQPMPHPPLPSWFNLTRPGFGCFAYGTDPETEKFEKAGDHGKSSMWVPKFMYFTKYKMPPSSIQPMAGGDIYGLTIWWDRPDRKRKFGVPQQIPIFISKDGREVAALKVLETRHKVARSRHGKFQIPHRGWGFPEEYEEWAHDFHDDTRHFLVGLFLDAITISEASNMASMVRVAVTRNRMTAVFSVNIRRMAYFFQDRDIEVTSGGARRRVFHVVRPHVRADGTAIKMHFRGARDFTWAGYAVHISVPGKDHANVSHFDVGFADEEYMDKEDNWLTEPELGGILAEHMRTGRWEGARKMTDRLRAEGAGK
jgi:hypothetical protein